MNAPDIHAETQTLEDSVVMKIHMSNLNSRTPFNFPEFIDPKDVEKNVNTFNDLSKDLILEYNYTRVDKRTLTVQTLFKPLFTKLGESQKYAHFSVCREGDRSFRCERIKGIPREINVPVGVDPIPVLWIQVAHKEVEPVPYVEIHVKLLDKVAAYKNVNLVISFVTKLIQSVFDHLET